MGKAQRDMSRKVEWGGKTEKRVKNTTRRGIFLTNFEVIHLVMKHCSECFITTK